jgi:hypothetical protein
MLQAHRGWTFQEYLLSPRKLIFTPQTILWECYAGANFESIAFGTWCLGAGYAPSFGSRFQIGLRPSEAEGEGEGASDDNATAVAARLKHTEVRLFIGLVRAYNSRELTFPEDGLNAFAGALSALQQTTFPQGFLLGLPVEHFHLFLLWKNSSPMQRRVARGQHSTKTALPSWTWVGWKVFIDTLVPMRTADPPDILPAVQPLCKWSFTEAQDAVEQKSKYQVGSRNPRQPDRFLYATVETCKWHVRGLGLAPQHVNIDLEVLTTDLAPTEGQSTRVGTLTADARILPSRWTGMAECVAVSTSCIKKKSDAGSDGAGLVLDVGEIELNLPTHYNVIWIDREDDHWTRKGVGTIEKAAWESATGRRMIELKLG